MKGSYVLILKVKKDVNCNIGRLGKTLFKKRFYAYVGSAMNGLERRVSRHLSSNKRLHWHIDYLLKCSNVEEVFYKESEKKEECTIAGAFNGFIFIEGFGSSDCKCRSHLFFSEFKEKLAEVCRNIGMKHYMVDE